MDYVVQSKQAHPRWMSILERLIAIREIYQMKKEGCVLATVHRGPLVDCPARLKCLFVLSG